METWRTDKVTDTSSDYGRKTTGRNRFQCWYVAVPDQPTPESAPCYSVPRPDACSEKALGPEHVAYMLHRVNTPRQRLLTQSKLGDFEYNRVLADGESAESAATALTAHVPVDARYVSHPNLRSW